MSALALGAVALLSSIALASAADPAQQAVQQELLQRQWQQQELRQRLQEGAADPQGEGPGNPDAQLRRLDLQWLRQSQERALAVPPPPSESKATREARRALLERTFREQWERLEGQTPASPGCT